MCDSSSLVGAADQTSSDTRADDTLEDLAENVAVTEALIAGARERRIALHDPAKLQLTGDDDVVETFSPDRTNHPFVGARHFSPREAARLPPIVMGHISFVGRRVTQPFVYPRAGTSQRITW
jgi:hypothetical protein